MQLIKELTPIIESPTDYRDIEKEIEEFLKKEIYLPIMRLMGFTIKNSIMDLVDAIRESRIVYTRGGFEGSFNSMISRELRRLGAVMDKKKASFRIPESNLPADIKIAIGYADEIFKKRMAEFNKLVEDIGDRPVDINLESHYDKVIKRTDAKFRASIKQVTVAPDLTEETRKRITKEYTENMQKFIKDWRDKEIIKLREHVEERVAAGMRYEGLIKEIQKSYGVGKSKATFLARQETSLMVSKLKQSRYQEAGINIYRWKTVAGSPDHPVRPMHKALDGKIFSWDNPPITDDKGSRNHPHEDYNCRCIAIPVVRF